MDRVKWCWAVRTKRAVTGVWAACGSGNCQTDDTEKRERPTAKGQPANQPTNRGSTCGSGSGAGAHRLDWLTDVCHPNSSPREREKKFKKKSKRLAGWLAVCLCSCFIGSMNAQAHTSTGTRTIRVDSKKRQFSPFFSFLPDSCLIFLPQNLEIGSKSICNVSSRKRVRVGRVPLVSKNWLKVAPLCEELPNRQASVPIHCVPTHSLLQLVSESCSF